jgi:tungstate transport system substrate-binding protein
MENGYGSDRFLVMYNDFVLVGPKNDPAGILGLKSPEQSLELINHSQSAFISRADDSGTHKKELAFWSAIGISPQGEWYLETGQGMAASLRIASEKEGYTLTDRATYLANRDYLASVILVEGHNQLLNVYHVIVVNPEKWPQVNYTGAQTFAEYLISDETQSLIGNFGLEQFGQALFIPAADKTDSELGLE